MKGPAAMLCLLLAADRPPPAKVAPRPNARGEAVYKQACAVCHMADGSGVPALQPAIDGGNRVVGGNPDTLIALLLRGADAALPADRERYSNQMPTFETLGDGEIASVLSYLRAAFGNKAPAITAERVAAGRARR
jgi:mono/diheme cytochrome c family protein